MAELEAFGYEVSRAEKVDLVVFDKQCSGMWLEVKMGNDDDRYMRNQLMTAAFSRLPFAFVTTPAEAVEYAKKGIGISEKQKNAIALALAAEPNRTDWTPAMMRRILE